MLTASSLYFLNLLIAASTFATGLPDAVERAASPPPALTEVVPGRVKCPYLLANDVRMIRIDGDKPGATMTAEEPAQAVKRSELFSRQTSNSGCVLRAELLDAARRIHSNSSVRPVAKPSDDADTPNVGLADVYDAKGNHVGTAEVLNLDVAELEAASHRTVRGPNCQKAVQRSEECGETSRQRDRRGNDPRYVARPKSVATAFIVIAFFTLGGIAGAASLLVGLHDDEPNLVAVRLCGATIILMGAGWCCWQFLLSTGRI